jgi:hypothetical protein
MKRALTVVVFACACPGALLWAACGGNNSSTTNKDSGGPPPDMRFASDAAIADVHHASDAAIADAHHASDAAIADAPHVVDGAVADHPQGGTDSGSVRSPDAGFNATDGGIVLARGCGSGGFCWQNPLPEGNVLRGSFMLSPTNAWAVGGAGTLLHYDGTAWTEVPSGTTADLYGVWASSATDVYAVGNGVIVHDNGSGFAAVTPAPTTNILYGVWGSGPNDIFAVGAAGTILHYKGTTWDPNDGKSCVFPYDLYGVSGANASDVWTVGAYQYAYHYNGSAWGSSYTGSGSNYLYGVYEDPASGTVWAVGDSGLIVKYTSASASWQSVGSAFDNLRAVWASSATDVWTVGLQGTVEHDKGTGFMPWTAQTSSDFYAMSGSDTSHALAVGNAGAAMAWNGLKWQQQTSAPTWPVNALWGTSPTDVWAGTDAGMFHWDGNAWTLTDTGATSGQIFNAVGGTSSTDVWAHDAGGRQMFHWTGGPSWSGMSDGAGGQAVNALWMADRNTGWAVGNNGLGVKWNGTAWGTVGGAIDPSLFNLNAIWGADASHVYAVGDYETIVTYDGTTWSATNLPGSNSLRAVWGSDATHVWAVGDSGTTDFYDGTGWSSISNPATLGLTGVWGSSANDVWAVGSQGTVMHWTGGWATAFASTYENLASVWVASTGDVWVSGPNGAILHR